MSKEDLPQIIEHLSSSVNFTPFDTRWIPCSAKFICLGINPRGTGALKIFELNHGSLDIIAESEKSKGLKCGTFGASAVEDRHLATGDYDGMLNIWYF